MTDFGGRVLEWRYRVENYLLANKKKNERFWRKFFFVSFQNWARINRPRQTSCTDDCVA